MLLQVGVHSVCGCMYACVCVCVWQYLSCYIAGFDLLDDRSIDDVVNSIFGHSRLVKEAPVEMAQKKFKLILRVRCLNITLQIGA